MAAGKYSFIIEQGSTTNFTIIYTDSTGAPIDLTSYGSKMQIRLTYDAPPIITLSSSLNPDGTGLNMTNAASGPVVNRILEGKVKLSREVTIIG